MRRQEGDEETGGRVDEEKWKMRKGEDNELREEEGQRRQGDKERMWTRRGAYKELSGQGVEGTNEGKRRRGRNE